jgi:hypothetical protein
MAGNLVSTVSVGVPGVKRSVNGFRHMDAGKSVPIEVQCQFSQWASAELIDS